ncbi:hypothetical protein RvY_09633 [Ramazzottius varieornatus]|uniref:Uncharacterized protein n=1 Tax=Ramazzottius varieornatus TaxID=947166 RepID=A0A1D1VCF7_RAMVA|nr:hypothetical protein RvY_09633 [Ramazzottius varieornatus]
MASGDVSSAPLFPVKDDLSPVKMPPSFQHDISEFELLDLYAMDLRVDNPETWLSGPIEGKRASRGMRKSTSLGALNRASLVEVPFTDGDDFAPASEHILPAGSPPSQSTPNNPSKTVRRFERRAGGDGPVSPVPHVDFGSEPEDAAADELNKTVVHAANRTFGKEEQLPQSSAQTNGVKTEQEPASGNEPSYKIVGKAVASGMQARPSAIVRPGLRPPSKPPVTTSSVGSNGMNRTTSLGNLSSNKLSVGAAPANNIPAIPTRTGSLTGGLQGMNGIAAPSVRASSTTRGTVKSLNGPLNTVQPKIGGSTATMVRRPVTAKIPSGIPTPSSTAGASSRIPRPVKKV